MEKRSDSYKQIVKATSLFGGVQIIKIIIQIIKSKFVALFLGPTGMGIVGLLTSTIDLISGLTNFGLGTSAVKNIASANSTNDERRISTVVKTIRKLVWATGFLGMILIIVFSKYLSQITFGNSDYQVAFIWISISLLLNQLSTGQLVILQGMRKLNLLAMANLAGSFIGLIIIVPIYYFYRLEGIVPAIIITSSIAFLMSWFYSSKVKIRSEYFDKGDSIKEAKEMLTLGFVLSMSGLLTTISSYIVRIYINGFGSISDVGLYTAGFAIINSYFGLVFTAMSTDYFPRLSEVAYDNEKSKLVINQQAEILLLILSPLIILFVLLAKWMIILLYSTKFIAIEYMLIFASVGIFFRAVSWSISFIFSAKGNSKVFFYNELIANVYFLGFNILGYHLFGLTGFGLSFIVGYLVYFVQVYLISKHQYNFSFFKAFISIFFIQFFLTCLIIFSSKFIDSPLNYIFGSVIFSLSFLYSYKQLDKRIDLKLAFQRVKNFGRKNKTT